MDTLSRDNPHADLRERRIPRSCDNPRAELGNDVSLFSATTTVLCFGDNGPSLSRQTLHAVLRRRQILFSPGNPRAVLL
ncbi:MAG: hypothetical protein QHH04_08245 [Methanolinea sp.]|nr:hypothetical protein [Methanolinea sp.]